MSDKFSFSEMDYVPDDFTEVNEAEDESTASKNKHYHSKVNLELPPGVINVSQELQASSQEKSPGSSIAPSCVRRMNELNLKLAAEDDSHGESSTEYAVLGQPSAGDARHDEADDNSSLASSEWSQVMGPKTKTTGYKSSSSTCSSEMGGVITSSGFRVLYSCDDSTTYSYENRQASSNASLGSLASTFDVISIGGNTIRRCKKCTFHNHQSNTLCAICETALVGDPCIELDEQIARNLEAKYDKDDFTRFQARERERESLHDKPPAVVATFFAEEVEALAQGFSFIQQLPRVDLSGQAMFFIARAIQRGHGTEIALFYCFTLSNDDTVDAVRKRGFQTNARVGFENTTTIDEDVDAAWSRFSNHALFPITETEDECMLETTSGARGWLVAIAEDSTTYSAQVSSSRSVASEHVLPLVSFDARERHRQDLKHLKAGMKQICIDFFEITLGIKPPIKTGKTEFGFDRDLRILDGTGANTLQAHSAGWGKQPFRTRPMQQSPSQASESRSDSADDSMIAKNLEPKYDKDDFTRFQAGERERESLHDRGDTEFGFDRDLRILDETGANTLPTDSAWWLKPPFRLSWLTRSMQQSASQASESMSDSDDDLMDPLSFKPSCEELPSQDNTCQMAPGPDHHYSRLWDWPTAWEPPKHQQQPQNPVASPLNDQRWSSGNKEDDIHDNLTPPAKKIAGIPELPSRGCDASLHPDEDNSKSWCSEPAPQGYGPGGRAGLKEDPDNDDQDDCHSCHAESAIMGCRDAIAGSKSSSIFEILQNMQVEQLHKALQNLGVAEDCDLLLWSRPLCITTIERFCKARGMTEEDLIFFAEL